MVETLGWSSSLFDHFVRVWTFFRFYGLLGGSFLTPASASLTSSTLLWKPKQFINNRKDGILLVQLQQQLNSRTQSVFKGIDTQIVRIKKVTLLDPKEVCTRLKAKKKISQWISWILLQQPKGKNDFIWLSVTVRFFIIVKGTVVRNDLRRVKMWQIYCNKK